MKKDKALIVGGGLGGMSVAISLAARGYQVEIFEKNDHLGGKLNRKEQKGFEFDLGPSILTMPHIFARLFQLHDRKMEDYLKITRLEREWRCFFEDGTRIDLYADPEKLYSENEVVSLQDREEVEDYLDYCREIGRLVEEGYFKKGLDTFWQVVRHYGVVKSLRGFDYFSTMAEAVESHLSSKHLQDIFNFFIKYVGSSPYRAPAVLNLLPFIQFEYGLWYVPGGLYNLSRGLQQLISELDIEVFTGTEVTKITAEEEKVTGVMLKNGSYRSGDLIISNMEVIPALRELLSAPELADSYEQKFEPACSGYVLHLGLDREYPFLDHHNFFFSRNPRNHFRTVFENYQLPEDPTIYLVATTRSEAAQAPPGCENVKILPHIPHLQYSKFTAADYRNLRQNVLAKLERMGFADIREHIITEDEWFPRDIRDRYYSNQGAIYGVVSDRKKNKGFKAPKKSELYSNLYFVGGSVNPGGGMPMVVLSGQQAAEMAAGKKNDLYP